MSIVNADKILSDTVSDKVKYRCFKQPKTYNKQHANQEPQLQQTVNKQHTNQQPQLQQTCSHQQETFFFFLFSHTNKPLDRYKFLMLVVLNISGG